ncbi:MAG: hypothetical protein ACREQA_15355 [Candidatus Binatia bacterium]
MLRQKIGASMLGGMLSDVSFAFTNSQTPQHSMDIFRAEEIKNESASRFTTSLGA